jgi:hypothetical protein
VGGSAVVGVADGASVFVGVSVGASVFVGMIGVKEGAGVDVINGAFVGNTNVQVGSTSAVGRT